MKKSILIAGALLVFGASASFAAGINLSWDDCGITGTANKTFACNVTTGLNTAIASFDPPAGIGQFIGCTGQVDITTDQAALPDWWKHGAGFCRGTGGLSLSPDFTGGPFTCIDPYVQPSSGFQYDVGFGSPARARMRILVAIPVENAIVVNAGTEYYAFKVNLLRGATSNTCTGCQNPACIVLNEIQLTQPSGAPGGDPKINNPRERQHVTWQTPPTGPVGCPLSTATQSRTWGQVKSLYR